MTHIAIIGAGLAGLSLARALPSGADVTLFEKSRGIGGRMATRYAGDYEFDHGAQFFTAKSTAFQSALAPFQDAGSVQPWPANVALIGDARETSAQRYVSAPRMNTLCKSMAEGLSLKSKVQIAKLEKQNAQWILIDSDGQSHGPFDWVISAAPAPQTEALFPSEFAGHTALKSVRMAGCFSLMLGFEAPISLPWPAARIARKPVGWMAVNSAKPGRATGHSILIQSSNDWAQAHLEDDRDSVQAALMESAMEISGADLASASHIALHRWRYAATPVPAGTDYLLDETNKLAACGDWCLGSRVEAAFTSGHSLGSKLAELVA